jgi:hypothetical protein
LPLQLFATPSDLKPRRIRVRRPQSRKDPHMRRIAATIAPAFNTVSTALLSAGLKGW